MTAESYLAEFFKAYPDYEATVEDTGGAGLCAEFCDDLRAMFPELAHVCGHVSAQGALWAHHWCLTPTGEIVDPTREQFGRGPISYEPRWLKVASATGPAWVETR